MALHEVFEDSVEKFRIDPAGFALVGLGIAAQWLSERPQTLPDASAKLSLAGAGLALGGLVHLGNLFNYTRGIEASLQTVGFEATPFRVRAYCLRQASRVICQKTGHFEEYVALCDSKDELRYSFLPHV